MSELDLITHHCYITGQSCMYINNSLSEGYLMGVITMMLVWVIIEIINNINVNDVEKKDE
jgi:hypothetical protein